MYDEEDFIQLSALQHFLFCERQCALIHIEQVWEDNLLTAEGAIMHDKVHEARFEVKNGVRIERGLPLRSAELGLNGKADVVEFHWAPDVKRRVPFPVEYKHGRPKVGYCDKVQLCAQALCIEEMLQVNIPAGAIFYGRTRRRFDVHFDESLRGLTKTTTQRLHEFISKGSTPKPAYADKCNKCSLIELCKPKVFQRGISVSRYIRETLGKNWG